MLYGGKEEEEEGGEGVWREGVRKVMVNGGWSHDHRSAAATTVWRRRRAPLEMRAGASCPGGKLHSCQHPIPSTIPFLPTLPSSLVLTGVVSLTSASPRRILRYHCLSADEGMTTAGLPNLPSSRGDLSHCSRQTFSPVERMTWSQGRRSSSVRGMPALILATLAAGCRSSPSMKGMERLFARSEPMEDLPLRMGLAQGDLGAMGGERRCVP